jgi:hypothetical protein
MNTSGPNRLNFSSPTVSPQLQNPKAKSPNRNARRHGNILQLMTCAGVLVVLPVSGRAQGFDVSWFKIAGGGGLCTNGQYTLNGTVGQHDASVPMTNGLYSIAGGFWVALQTPGAPTLKIVPAAPGQATISWSPGSPGWRLQESFALTPAVWIDSPSGTNNPVTLPTTFPRKYYRLTKP